MGKKHAASGHKKAAADVVTWRGWLASAAAVPPAAAEGTIAADDPAATAAVQAQTELLVSVLSSVKASSLSDHSLFVGLGVAELNACVAGLEADSAQVVMRLAHVLSLSPPEVSAILAEHSGFVEGMTKLHRKVGDLTHPTSQATLYLLWTLVVKMAALYTDLALLAKKQGLLELVIAHIVFLSVTPAYLFSRDGIHAALRSVRIGYEMSKGQSPGGKAVRGLLLHADVPRRLLGLLARPPAGSLDDSAPSSSYGAPAAASTSASASAAGGDGAASSAAASAPAPLSLAEFHVKLLCMGGSFFTTLLGLGAAGVDLSAAGLAPHRRVLLSAGVAEGLKPPIVQLTEQLTALHALAGEQAAAEAKAGGGGKAKAAGEGGSGEQAPSEATRELLKLVDGSLRNMLVALLIPTVVRGNTADEIADGCNFVIQFFYGLYVDGLLDAFAALHDLAAAPQRYGGGYGPFFASATAHLLKAVPQAAKQLAEWGVLFKSQGDARSPLLQVGEGANAAAAQAWIAGLTPAIMQNGQAVVALLALANKSSAASQAAAADYARAKAASQQA